MLPEVVKIVAKMVTSKDWSSKSKLISALDPRTLTTSTFSDHFEGVCAVQIFAPHVSVNRMYIWKAQCSASIPGKLSYYQSIAALW